MNKNEKAIEYVVNLIKKLDEKAEAQFTQPENYHYQVNVNMQDKRCSFILDYDFMDDFNIALSEYKRTTYFLNMESAAKFKVIVALGMEGLIPNFNVSSEILNEKREWAKDVYFSVRLEPSFCDILYKGLNKLWSFLGDQITKHPDLGLIDIKNDKEYIWSLIDYYNKKKSFTEKRASIKSLGYLKAAAVCEIIDKENKKKEVQEERIKKEIDKNIYSIVLDLHKAPFLEVSLPECIYEYASYKTLEIKKEEQKKEEGKTTKEKSQVKTTQEIEIKEWAIKEEKFVSQVRTESKNLYKCFTVMPIGEDNTKERELNDGIFYKIIKPCIENSGYNITCFHSGLIGDTGSIPEQIIENLYNSDIVVADLRGLNPNVTYELGIRHTFLKRSIMIYCDNRDIKSFFDVSEFRAAKYNINGESNKDFFNKISSFVHGIITDPKKIDNPVWRSKPAKFNPAPEVNIKGKIDEDRTHHRSYFQGGNRMEVSSCVIIDNAGSRKNYIMEREFLLLDSKREFLGKLGIAGERYSTAEEEIGLAVGIFRKGQAIDDDGLESFDFKIDVNLDNLKNKADIKEKEDLILLLNFIPREGSPFIGGEVKFPVIFSRS